MRLERGVPRCDTFMQLVTFASVTAERLRAADNEADDRKAENLEDAVEKIYQTFALLSAIAADRLTHGDLSRMEERSKLRVAWREQLLSRHMSRA